MSIEDFDLLEEMNSGEKELYNKCLKYVSDNFKIIPNAIFNRHDEGTNQIDLITITKKGIFVIEIKDYKGWIFGDENHKNWTQSLNAGKGKSKQYKFRNPIKQNENHIKTLKKILIKKGYDNLPVYNVVVFGNDAVLKEVTKSIDVVNLKDIEKVFEKYRDLVITPEEISNIYNFLYSEVIKEKNAISEHIKYVNSFQSENSTIETNTRVNQDLSNNNVFDGNKFSLKVVGRYILKYKKITIIILIIILSLILENGIMLLGIIILGTLAIKFKEPRAMGLAILMLFILLSSNSHDDFSSNKNHGNNNSEITNIENDSVQSDETISNTIADDMSEEDKTIVLGDEINKDQGTNDMSNNNDVKNEAVDETIINDSDNPTMENSQKNNATEADIQVKTNETINEEVEENKHEKENVQEAIFIGTPKSLVEEFLGEPDKVTTDATSETWHYQSSNINFDERGLVNGWNNRYGVLNSGMQFKKEGSEAIDIGSTKEEVLSALGSPTKINSNNHNIWFYNASEVSFSERGLVNGWNNRYGVLNSGMQLKREGAEAIDIGSTKEEVLIALGSPTKINSNNQNIWFYNASEVSFSERGLVNGWNNRYGVLNSGMQLKREGAEAIDIGSTKEEVLIALGSPTKINSNNQNIWFYNASEVSFSERGLVNGWNNRYGVLNSGMQLKKEGSETIVIGSTKENVINALGSPTKINPSNTKVWYYKQAYINFDSNDLVDSWRDAYNILSDKVSQ